MRSRSCVEAEDAVRGVEGRRDSVHDLRLGTLKPPNCCETIGFAVPPVTEPALVVIGAAL
jgi:hypothetical protein